MVDQPSADENSELSPDDVDLDNASDESAGPLEESGKTSRMPRRQQAAGYLYSEWNSDYPHPADLERYEIIHPGFTERILASAEAELKHRHVLENKIVNNNARSQLFGQIAALGTVVLITALAFYLAYQGYSWESTVVVGAEFCGLVGLFLNSAGKQGSKGNKDESQNNSDTP